LLISEHSVRLATIDRYLTIHEGDAKSASDLAYALINPLDETFLVDIIYYSLGIYPVWQFSLVQPFVLPDPTFCETTMARLFSSIDQLQTQGIKSSVSGQKPLLIATSSTASRNITRSVPFLMVPFYAWLLSSPHNDKLNMEKIIYADNGVHVRDFVIIRPAIMTNGVERGVQNVRIGWEWGIESPTEREQAPGPAKGWTISRRDVGGWVYQKAIKEGGWEGRCVSICY
jgi:hypothetical protein